MPCSVAPYDSDNITDEAALIESKKKHFEEGGMDVNEKSNFVSEEDTASWRKYDEEAITSLMAKLAKLESHETELLSQLTPVRAEKEKTEYWISLLKGKEMGKMRKVPLFSGERVNGHVESKENVAEEEVICGNTTLSDIAGCPSQRKAMYIVGEMNGGVIDLNQAAALVVAAGMSKTDVRTVSATLHNFMSNHDDFEWTGPSKFRLRTDDDPEPTTGDEMAQAERNRRRVRI